MRKDGDVPTKDLHDHSQWNGVKIRSHDFGATGKRNINRQTYVHDGRTYRTGSEAHLAEMLRRQRIPFTSDVLFELMSESQEPRIYVPDFIFNKNAYVWQGSRGRKPMLIHGIEAKDRNREGKFPERAWENVRILEKQRGIVILLLSNEAIARHWRQERLPLEPNDP